MVKIFWAIFYFVFCPSIFASELSYNKDVFFREIKSPLVEYPATYSFYSGAALTTGLSIFEDTLIDPAQKEATEKKHLGHYSKGIELMGVLIPNAIYSIGMGVGGLSTQDRSYYSNALVMIKSTAYSALVTNILKYTIQEHRPNHADHLSFPSGHTTMAFAFAGVVTGLHQWYFAVPAFAMASLVGFQRMDGNAHYLHDVVAGATIGFSYGLGVAAVTNQRKEPSSVTTMVFPFNDGGLLSLSSSF